MIVPEGSGRTCKVPDGIFLGLAESIVGLAAEISPGNCPALRQAEK
jgi:hypothetical protein